MQINLTFTERENISMGGYRERNIRWFTIFAICGSNRAAAPWEKSRDVYWEVELGPILVYRRGILHVFGTHSDSYVVKRWNLPDENGGRAGSVLVCFHGILH